MRRIYDEDDDGDNMTKLERAQAKMRVQQSIERGLNKAIHPSNRLQLPRSEAEEIKEISGRTDLLCPYCAVNSTTASRKTGCLFPCKFCFKLRKSFKNLSLHDYSKILREQNSRCAICNVDFVFVERSEESPHVDYDFFEHVRGLLCASCSRGLGAFGNNETALDNAGKYVRFNKRGRFWWTQKCNYSK